MILSVFMYCFPLVKRLNVFLQAPHERAAKAADVISSPVKKIIFQQATRVHGVGGNNIRKASP